MFLSIATVNVDARRLIEQVGGIIRQPRIGIKGCDISGIIQPRGLRARRRHDKLVENFRFTIRLSDSRDGLQGQCESAQQYRVLGKTLGAYLSLSYPDLKEVKYPNKTYWCVIFTHKQALDVSIIHDLQSFARDQIW